MGIALHLDGARIWNAHIASGVALAEYGKYFETISVCLSKGLGAPVGSLLISSKELIAKARPWRKRYGAGMRQAGILAAAGHYALDNNLERLSQDHKMAKSIATAVAAVAPSVIDPSTVDTNIVGLDLTGLKISASQLATQLKEAGVLASALGPTYLRLVTHMDVTESDISKVNEILPQLLQRALVA